MANNNVIPAGLRADRMRKQMENKNILSAKGYMYVGTGNSETIAGGTVYETTYLAPSATAGLPLLSKGTGAYPAYEKIKPAAIDNMLVNGSDVTASTTSASTINGLTATLTQSTAGLKIALTGTSWNIPVGSALLLTAGTDSQYATWGRLKVGGKAFIHPTKTDYCIGITGWNNDAAQTSGGILFGASTASNGGKLYYNGSVFSFDKQLNVGVLSGSGNWSTTGTMGASEYNATSDQRLKENIVNYKYHDSILDIPVKEFDFKESGIHTIGFIAQELQEKYPELVHEGENGYLSISETKLIYLLLLETKKLRDRIQQLEKGE